MNLPVFVESEDGGMCQVSAMLKYIAHAYSTRKLQANTIGGHLAAVKYYHPLACGFELNTSHPLLANALKGVTRGHTEFGISTKIANASVAVGVAVGGAGVGDLGNERSYIGVGVGGFVFFYLRVGNVWRDGGALASCVLFAKGGCVFLQAFGTVGGSGVPECRLGKNTFSLL